MKSIGSSAKSSLRVTALRTENVYTIHPRLFQTKQCLKVLLPDDLIIHLVVKPVLNLQSSSSSNREVSVYLINNRQSDCLLSYKLSRKPNMVPLEPSLERNHENSDFTITFSTNKYTYTLGITIHKH